jgi:hypothetical protein
MRTGLPETMRSTTDDAADKVATWTKIGFPLGPADGGHAISSIKASRGTVSEGGARFPYVGFLDFGGRVGIHGAIFRPFIGRGRYLWASLGDHKEQVDRIFAEGLTRLARNSGMDVD